MSEMPAAGSPPPGPAPEAHALPLRVLVRVWGALIALTWLTVAAAGADLGSLNLIAALAIAAVKSTFVALYFMHLRYDQPINAIVFACAVLMVLLLITLALMDTRRYQADVLAAGSSSLSGAQSLSAERCAHGGGAGAAAG